MKLICTLTLAIAGLIAFSSMAIAATEVMLPITNYAVIAPPDHPFNGTALLSIPIPESLASKVVLQAEILCSLQPRLQRDSLLEVIIIPINTQWDPNHIGWNDSWRELGSNLIDSMKTFSSLQTNLSDTARMDITDIVRRWLDRTYPNYGVALKTPMDLDRWFQIRRLNPNQREIAMLRIIFND
jgi:hypothetical protein